MTPNQDNPHARRVYSTDGGRVPKSASSSPAATPPGHPADGVVRVSRTSSGRGGKTVTLVTGLPQSDVESTAKALKRLCGTGGTTKGGIVEIQGDHRERIAAHLSATYRTKLAGG